MANHTVTFEASPGLTLSAYPRYYTDGTLVSLAVSAANDVLCTETSHPVKSVYTVTVSDSFSEWWIMTGTGLQPDWTAFANVTITFTTLSLAVPIVTSGTPGSRGVSTSLIAYKDEVPTYTVELEDTDLSGLTLEFVIEDQEQNDKEVISSGSIDAGEDYFTVTIPATITDEIGTYRWSLRDITGGANTIVSFGVLSVNYAASNDA